MSPATQRTGNAAPNGFGGSWTSKSVRLSTCSPPRAPSAAKRCATLRPRNPAPPRMETCMPAPLWCRTSPGLVPAQIWPMPFRCFLNPRQGSPGIVVLSSGGYRRAKQEITGWPGYAPTPLRALPDLATSIGVGAMSLKDEGDRFGLGSFKALGGAYAVAQVLLSELARTGVAPA